VKQSADAVIDHFVCIDNVSYIVRA
jgi:hypothetical protein